MKTKLLTAVACLALLGAAAVPALAASPEPPVAAGSGEAAAAPGFAIEINGEDSGVRACVMVPLRAIAEKLGFAVTWDNGTVTVTGTQRYVELTIGVDQYFAAPTQEGMVGASLFPLGCAPTLINDVTYVPVGLFDALLGCKEGTVKLEGDTVKISGEAGFGAAVQIPNPFTDHATLAEAAEAAGFPMSAPDALDGCPRRVIQTMDGEMIQVFYGDGGGGVCIRKASGSGDISGDYNQYAQTGTVEVRGCAVTTRGENGLIMVAIWEDGGYTYAITSHEGMGAAALAALVRSVK